MVATSLIGCNQSSTSETAARNGCAKLLAVETSFSMRPSGR